ncbi:MAG: hypothetical protein ACXWUG_11215 [Polyangiales bacterium]
MRCTLATVFGIAALAVTASASAEVFAVPHLVATRQAAPLPVLTLGELGAGAGIFDLRTVQEDPVMRARRDYSLMAALPVTTTSVARMPSFGDITPSNMKLSRDIMLTFPLGLASKSFVTAEIAGKGKIAIDSTGFNAGGVFTFKGEF